jgi:hypothetical protein
MLSIQGLEIDYLRAELKRMKELHRIHEGILVESIYEWIMSNEGMGMGDAATTMDEAKNIVKNWRIKCKNIK